MTVHRGGTPPEARGAQIRDELLEPALPLLRDERFLFRAI